MFILQSFFHSQYQLSRNCLVSVKQRPVIGVYCPSVSFADLCFGEQLCRFFVSVLWFSVQDNSYLGYSEVSSYFFLFHELKTKRQQNMWNVTQVYSKFLVIFGPGKLLQCMYAMLEVKFWCFCYSGNINLCPVYTNAFSKVCVFVVIVNASIDSRPHYRFDAF